MLATPEGGGSRFSNRRPALTDVKGVGNWPSGLMAGGWGRQMKRDRGKCGGGGGNHSPKKNQ